MDGYLGEKWGASSGRQAGGRVEGHPPSVCDANYDTNT